MTRCSLPDTSPTLMLLITLTQEQITDPLFGRPDHLRVPELREALSALAFLLMMLESWRALVPDRAGARITKPAE